jgi:hypothetical protein
MNREGPELLDLRSFADDGSSQNPALAIGLAPFQCHTLIAITSGRPGSITLSGMPKSLRKSAITPNEGGIPLDWPISLPFANTW